MKKNNFLSEEIYFIFYDLFFLTLLICGFLFSIGFFMCSECTSLVQQYFIARQMWVHLPWKKAHSHQNDAVLTSLESLNR